MLPSTRATNLLAASIVLALALGVAAPSDTVQLRQIDVVRSIAQPDQLGLGEEGLLALAAARAASLLDVRLPSDGDGQTLVMRVQGDPVWDVRRSDDGARLLIDLHGTIGLLGDRHWVPGDPSLVRRLHTSFSIEDNAFVTRVEADLARPSAYTVRQQGGTIEIDLLPFGRTFSEPASPAEVLADLGTIAMRRMQLLQIGKARVLELAARDLDAIRAEEEFVDSQQALDAVVADREELRKEQTATVSMYLDGAVEEDAVIDARIAALAEKLAAEPRMPGSAKREVARIESEIEAAMEADRAYLASFENESAVIERAFAERLAELRDADRLSREHREFYEAQRRMREVLDAAPLLDPEAGDPERSEGETQLASTEPDALESVTFQAVDLAQMSFRLADRPQLAATSDTGAALSVLSVGLAQSPEPTAEAAGPAAETAPPASSEPEVEEAAPAAPTEADAQDAPEAEPTEATPEAPAAGQVQTISVAPAARRPSERTGDTDPLYEPVTIDFREMDLSNVVAILAQKAQINVIAGNDVSVTGTVTAYLQDVPLLRAMETVLRMNDLGIVEEEGIFRIVPYREALAARYTTRIIHLQRAQSADVQTTLDAVTQGMPEGARVSVAINDPTNTIVLSGPEERVAELEALTHQLDVAEPTLPTETVAIKLNYAEPQQVQPLVESMLTPDVGSVESDQRSRHVIVTDQPMVIEQVQDLIKQVDKPVRQVAIEAMVVDAVLRDSSQTGVNWLVDLVRSRDRVTGEATGILSGNRNTRGEVIGSLQDLNFGGNLGNIGADALDAGILTFGVLTDNFDLRGAIAAEVASRNAEILANPVSVTLENNQASLEIVQEYPYQEITQSTQGPPVSSTEFKDIGITLEVMPRVTHENDIIVSVDVKQSSVSGLTEDGIPIEDRRSAKTELRTKDGRTIFIGGLRNVADRTDVSKIPVLGDLPVVNFMFRTTDIEKTHTELLIFLTCHVIQDLLPELTPAQQVEFDKMSDVPDVPDAQRAYFRSLVNPGEMRDPAWKWRRTP